MAKKFDPTKPHKHQCSSCWKEVFCCGPDCQIPKHAECLECQRGDTVQRFSFTSPLTFRNVVGYRRTAQRDDSY
jgi:hypothetical protein